MQLAESHQISNMITDAHASMMTPIEIAWAQWLEAHNRRRHHHWTEESFERAMEREARMAELLLSLPINSASDLAAVIFSQTAFGEFDFPDAVWSLLDRIAKFRS